MRLRLIHVQESENEPDEKSVYKISHEPKPTITDSENKIGLDVRIMKSIL